MGRCALNFSLFLPCNRIDGGAESSGSSESNFYKYQVPLAINHDQIDLANAALVITIGQLQSLLAQITGSKHFI